MIYIRSFLKGFAGQSPSLIAPVSNERYRKEVFILKAVFLLSFVIVCAFSCKAQAYSCLSTEVKASDVASLTILTSKTGKTYTQKVTVKQTLQKLRARCSRGKLVDSKGREIRFLFVQGCWGNPPADYLEILERQRIEIERLKKLYTVIEMTCNPSGVPPRSIGWVVWLFVHPPFSDYL